MAGPSLTDQQLASEIHELRRDFQDLRVEVAEKLGSIQVDIVQQLGSMQVDIVQQLGSIQTSLEGFRGRTETSFRVAIWGIGIASVVAISVVGSVIAGTWSAAKLDSRVQQLESHASVDHAGKGAK
jgi:hypothetical protein